jgi:hypothetical protein
MRFLLRRQELVSHNSVRINFDRQIELWRFWFGANQNPTGRSAQNQLSNR